MTTSTIIYQRRDGLCTVAIDGAMSYNRAFKLARKLRFPVRLKTARKPGRKPGRKK